MKNELELALVACSYRLVKSKDKIYYMKLYGFNWIIFDLSAKELSSYFAGGEDLVCWNVKSFEELFDEDFKTIEQYVKAIQYYERYNGPHGHGGIPMDIHVYMLIDDYFRQIQCL